jgi:hypothetical protein
MLKKLTIQNNCSRQILTFIKPALLPLLFSIYPAIYIYAINAEILLIDSLIRILIFNAGLAIGIYFVALTLGKFRQPLLAGNAAFIFLLFFNTYGLIHKYLLKMDVFQVEHFTFLPLFLVIGLYASWLMTKLKKSWPNRVWIVAIVIVGVLIVFNSMKIASVELNKLKISTYKPVAVTENISSDNEKYPDIYYIILDEFSGFEPMRKYWHYGGVDAFDEFLKSRGFYVVENATSDSTDTLHQMSERLNYQIYRTREKQNIYFEAINHNNAMAYLKKMGYTTVVFEEMNMAYPSMPSPLTDYSYKYGSEVVEAKTPNGDIWFDEFGIVVGNNTMLKAFSILDGQYMASANKMHWEFLTFTTNKIGEMDDISSPKFVYVHVLLPHYPFMFYENGIPNKNTDDYFNWNSYLDNYQFAIKFAEGIVNNILKNADPINPPVIILQSDHGARGKAATTHNGVALENYPEEYAYSILNALYIPGYDFSNISQNMDEINTFPIIFNYLFDAGIPLR